MSTTAGVPSTAPDPTEVPARANGLVLIGTAQGSGYRTPPALVRRADGQTIQLTTILYAVLEAVDGQKTIDEVAAAASDAAGRTISGDNVRSLIDGRLRPLGLLRRADGSEPELVRSDPLLGMRLRRSITDPATTRRLTAPFAVLFAPIVVAIVLVAFAVACWWLLFIKGLGSATHDAFDNPHLLLLIVVVTILSAGFHEFGHAAAARRGGAEPGAMGVGLYLIWPAFYTDVTDSYRLDRAGRLRTDLGGLYFNAIVAVAIIGVWWLSRFDALLLVVVAQLLQMVRQLLPLLRFDGYHILADLVGVPDLFARIKPTLLALLPWRPADEEAKALTPLARTIVSAWVLITVPLLLVTLALLVIALPRLIGTAWAAAQDLAGQSARAASESDVLGAVGSALGVVIVALPVAAIVYLLLRLGRQLGGGAIRATRGRPARRALAIAVGALLVGLLAWAWWPDAETYRPVQAYERGTIADAFPTSGASVSAGVSEGARGGAITALPEGASLGTIDDPTLAMILVPRDPSQPTWVFPFDRPLAPEGDDQQALAVATEDGSVVYDVAFALVWAEGDAVDTRNEAYAFASCTGCAAVAVGFQVVLVMGQADVIVPENLSAAVNYACVECLAYALASQLVLSVDEPLDAAAMRELDALWVEILAFEEGIQNVPLDEIQARLSEYKERIIAIVLPERAVSVDPTPTTSPTTAPSASSLPEPTSSSPAQPVEPAPTATVSPSPSVSPSTGVEEGAPEGSPSPSPSASP